MHILRAKYIGVTAVALLFLFITLPYTNFVPFWDGGINYHCLLDAITKPFDIFNFRCAEHASYAYFLLLSIGQYLDPGNVQLVHLTNITLALAAMIAFYKTLAIILPEDHYYHDRWLASGIFVFSPLLIANIFHTNFDYAITCFFTMYLYCLIAKKYWWAALAALALIFSKEVGVFIYAITVPIYLLHFTLPTLMHRAERVTVLKTIGILSLPGIAATIHWYTYLYVLEKPVQWNAADALGGSFGQKVATALDINTLDSGFQSYLVDIFVLNFNWILTAIIAIALVARWMKGKFGKQQDHLSETQRVYMAFVLLLLLAVAYLITRYRPFNNPRYVLVAYPALYLTASCALASLLQSQRKRAVILSITTILFITSIYRTVDPLSRAFFGTFSFGEHELLRMNSISIYNRKRDELVYNLEYTNLHYLADAIFQTIKPHQEADRILIGEWGDFGFPNVDSRTGALTGRMEHTYEPWVSEYTEDFSPEILRDMPEKNDHVYFVDLPVYDGNRQVRYLTEHYPLLSKKIFEYNGYAASLLTFSTTPLHASPL